MKVHELLSDESKWTRKHFAVDSEGNPCLADSSKASAWDVTGAITKCYGQSISAVINRLNLVEKVGNISSWNDSSDHPSVVSLLKELDI
jgi:hypothetical protein